MAIKCVLFDIGGVCVLSPVTGVHAAEKLWGLPPNYINVHITAQGHGGAFQRLERGELPLDEFYRQFGTELSNVESGNRAYRAHCHRIGKGELAYLLARRVVTVDVTHTECPTLPTSLTIDGKEVRNLDRTPRLASLRLQIYSFGST